MWDGTNECDFLFASLDKIVLKSIQANAHKISDNIYPIPVPVRQQVAPVFIPPKKQQTYPVKLHNYYNVSRQPKSNDEQDEINFNNSSFNNDNSMQLSGANFSQEQQSNTEPVYNLIEISYKVQFKTCYRFYSSFEQFKKGDFVIVASDYGGEHLGMIISSQSMEQFRAKNSLSTDKDTTPDDRVSGYVGQILRLAERWECESLPQKMKDERLVHSQCMKLIQTTKSLRLLKMHDVEWQFDRSVVYLQYSATEAFVDFRDFMKQIAVLCGVPVQMVRYNEAYNFTPKKFAEIGLTTGAVFL